MIELAENAAKIKSLGAGKNRPAMFIAIPTTIKIAPILTLLMLNPLLAEYRSLPTFLVWGICANFHPLNGNFGALVMMPSRPFPQINEGADLLGAAFWMGQFWGIAPEK